MPASTPSWTDAVSLPAPEPGLVISYAYLWRHEHNRGQDEGRKDRPCLVVLTSEVTAGGATRVTVAALTHVPPHASTTALELPANVKRHLGLDESPSWIILDEVNQFHWPGFDLRPVPHQAGTVAYGFIPPRLFQLAKARLLEAHARRQVAIIPRD